MAENVTVTGEVKTDYYSWYGGNNYLRVSYTAVPNVITGKYDVAYTIYAGGSYYGYNNTLHHVDLGMAGGRKKEIADAGISVGDKETVVARGNFEVAPRPSEPYGIELYGGFYDKGVNNVYGNGSFTLPAITVKPTVNIAKVSSSATTIKTKITSSNNVSLSNYKFELYKGNNKVDQSGEITQNEYEFTNLTPNTAYKVKGYGYGNNNWSENDASVSVTTNRQNSISNIGDFTLDGVTFTITGNPNDKSTIKILVGNTVVATRTNVGVGQYTLTLTDAEKETIYRLIGNNSSIGAVIRIDTGGATLDYNKNITLTGDVFSCSINVGGTIKKGKVWVGTPSGNKQGIFTIGTSNGNKRGR